MNFNYSYLKCDATQPWGVYFKNNNANPQMEALIDLHDSIMFYLAIILFAVAWIIFSIIINYVYNKSTIGNKYLNNGTLIELIWTITPALILILIAFPSFNILYCMDESFDTSLTVFMTYDVESADPKLIVPELNNTWYQWGINNLYTILNDIRAENNLLSRLMNERKNFLLQGYSSQSLHDNFIKIEHKMERMHRLVEVRFKISGRFIDNECAVDKIFNRRFPTLKQIENMDKADSYMLNPFDPQ